MGFRAAFLVVVALAVAPAVMGDISSECLAKPKCLLTDNYCQKVCGTCMHVSAQLAWVWLAGQPNPARHLRPLTPR